MEAGDGVAHTSNTPVETPPETPPSGAEAEEQGAFRGVVLPVLASIVSGLMFGVALHTAGVYDVRGCAGAAGSLGRPPPPRRDPTRHPSPLARAPSG